MGGPIQDLVSGFFGILQNLFEGLPVQRAALPTQVARGPVSEGRTASEGGRTAEVTSDRTSRLVKVYPVQYRIDYNPDNWNKDTPLFDLFEPGELVDYDTGHEFMKGWQFAPRDKDYPAAEIWGEDIWNAYAKLEQLGQAEARNLEYPLQTIKGPDKVDWDAEGFELNIPIPMPGQVVTLGYPSLSQTKKKFQIITGFWKMSAKGPKVKSEGEIIDLANAGKCYKTETSVTATRSRNIESLAAKLVGDCYEIRPVTTLSLHRKQFNTDSAKYEWYPFCKIYSTIGGEMPDWVQNIVTGVQKLIVD